MQAPAHWTPTDIDWKAAAADVRLGTACGWVFFANPTEPRGNVVALSLDCIGDVGPVVFDTGAATLETVTLH